jgi:hypothetical protein
MPPLPFAAAFLSLLVLAGCSSPEARACERAEDLYKQERSAGKAPAVGFSTEARDACLAKLHELKAGPRECLSRCYPQARDVGGLFDCERSCGVN